MNSVDKDANGDYMVSARHTDCMYKISGTDGHVIWRLGGDESSFVLDGFNFSKQHDARFIEQNATTTLVSFLNNASGGVQNATSSHSTAYLVALETQTQPMVARVVRRWDLLAEWIVWLLRWRGGLRVNTWLTVPSKLVVGLVGLRSLVLHSLRSNGV